MGVFHTAYLAYGVRITDTSPAELEQAMAGQGIGWLLAGRHGKDATFLTGIVHEADLGEHKVIDPGDLPAAGVVYRELDKLLYAAADRLRADILAGPGWILVPNED